jgi:hypothetical protein
VASFVLDTLCPTRSRDPCKIPAATSLRSRASIALT